MKTKIIIMIVTQDLVRNSILSLHHGERSGKFSQNGMFGHNGEFSQNSMSGQKGKVHLGPNVSSSAHDCGRVDNGGGAMAAIGVLLLLLLLILL